MFENFESSYPKQWPKIMLSLGLSLSPLGREGDRLDEGAMHQVLLNND